MSSTPFKCAVIGYGMSAKVFHIPLIQALPTIFTLYGIVQRKPRKGDDCMRDHPKAKHWTSVETMFADDAIDVVVVTSIPETHYEFTKRALEGGKHVVVEKPFVPTSKEADELVGIARKSGKKITVYQNRRWDADYLTLSKILREGALGDIAEFETHFDRHRPDPPLQTWKAEDKPAHGALYDLGSHLIDQVYLTFGMPRRVTAFIGNQRRSVKGGAPDSCNVILHYDGPMLVTVKAGVVSPEQEQLRYWVRGTKGSFKKFHLDCQEDQLKQGLRPVDEGFGVESEDHHGTLTIIEDGKLVRKKYPTIEPLTYVEYYRLLGKALHDECDVPVKAEDAANVLRILEMAIESSKESKTIEV